MIKKPDSGILAEIADKLKDRVLFPEQVEKARKYLENAILLKPFDEQHKDGAE